MKKPHSKKLLQVSFGICALIPILTGLLGMTGNANPIYPETARPVGLLLDSNLRFLNGLSVGIGVCALWTIPGIEQKSAQMRLICVILFVGAIGRLLSVVQCGFPPFPYNVMAFAEIALPAVFVIWQSKIAD